MNKRFSTPWAVFVTSLMVLMAFNMLIGNDGDTMVSAEAGATADAQGYTWIDNRDPDPKVVYEWMDISGTGTSIKDRLTLRPRVFPS